MTPMGRSPALFLCACLLLVVGSTVAAQEAGGITEITIQRLNSGDLIFDVGSQDGIRIGDQYEVIRERIEAGMGQYDQLAVIEIVRVIEDGSRAKIVRKASGIAFQAGDVLTIRWLVPGTVSQGDRNQRLFLSLQFGDMSFTDDASGADCWGDLYSMDCDFREYKLGWFWGGSLGIQISKRFDILGTFTMARLETIEPYPIADEIDGEPWSETCEDFAYSTSLNTRITIYRTDRIVTFGKIGGWVLIHDDSAPDVDFGVRTGLGARWEISRVFALGAEFDFLAAIAPGDAYSRISIGVVPEFTLVSW